MNNSEILIEEIIDKEWVMFRDVNKGLAVADCQEDNITFSAMRKAQFAVWSNDALQSYLDDLEKAEKKERNLLSEKYIHMMRTTSPIEYMKLLIGIEIPNEKASALAKGINEKLMIQTESLHKDYPCVTSMGRPLHSSGDDKYNTSVETYQLGELLTYSEKTLHLLKNHLDNMNDNGLSYAKEVLENTIRYWGYDDLESAEIAIKNR